MKLARRIQRFRGRKWQGCGTVSSTTYFRVDVEVVWDVVSRDLPPLREQVPLSSRRRDKPFQYAGPSKVRSFGKPHHSAGESAAGEG